MPTIGGNITDDGAVICVLVGVSDARRRTLQRAGFTVPKLVPVRAQIDTGSHVTGFSREVFNDLQIGAFGKVRLSTPSTRPDEPFYADQYEVTLSLVSGTDRHLFGIIRAIASDDFRRGDEVEAIIGRDVLNRCVFEYIGTESAFRLYF